MEAIEVHITLIWYVMKGFVKEVMFKLGPLRDEKLAKEGGIGNTGGLRGSQ